jgi:hypothetical protein
MPDHSALDQKYFVDRSRYNCPFCNRRNIVYEVQALTEFNWTDKKKCYVYLVECSGCKLTSMHLSFTKLGEFLSHVGWNWFTEYANQLDENIFFSVPSSYHVIDDRIPTIIRELLDEAQGCLKSNFLTGASVCVRKIVYELSRLQKADGNNYDDRIKNLKTKLPTVAPEYFDTLLTIQQITSDKVHEESYDGWQSKHLKTMIAILLEALMEIYVIPKNREQSRERILALKAEIVGTTKPKN